jgi:hypothetical protein
MAASAQAETVDKKEWRHFFDSVSSSLRGKGADITLSTVMGDVHQSRLWELHGVSYDPHDDAVIVSCRQQEHVISHPESIKVERIGPTISSVEVAMKQPGEREIIRFVSPVMLSAH